MLICMMFRRANYYTTAALKLFFTTSATVTVPFYACTVMKHTEPVFLPFTVFIFDRTKNGPLPVFSKKREQHIFGLSDMTLQLQILFTTSERLLSFL